MSDNLLLPCPFCRADVSFCNQEGCDGRHIIQCSGCKVSIDLYDTVNPNSELEDSNQVRNAIIQHWNDIE